jgi:hypothetical protein
MPVVKTLPSMPHLRQVRKAKPNRHTSYRAVFSQVSPTLFGKVRSSQAPKLPLETSSDRQWHRMTPSLVLGLTTMPLATCQQDKSVSGHECCEPRDRVTAALAGVPLGRAGALGRLPLQLREFRVDGAQTPLTGHLPPPPHRVGAPKATGGVLQIGEPSMDGVRHEGPPAPPARWVAASLSTEIVR